MCKAKLRNLHGDAFGKGKLLDIETIGIFRDKAVVHC